MVYSGTCIATEDLETLHPGATGLCFIMNVWLATLIGLTNALSTLWFRPIQHKINDDVMMMHAAFTWHLTRPSQFPVAIQ